MSTVSREDLLKVDDSNVPRKKLKLGNRNVPPDTVVNDRAGVNYAGANDSRNVSIPEEDNAYAPSGFKVIKSYSIDDNCSAQILWDVTSSRYRYLLIEPSLTAVESKTYSDIVTELHKKPRSELYLMKKLGGRQRIRQKFDRLCREKLVDKQLKEKMLYHIEKDFWGYKKIDALLKDRNVEDISCNGYSRPVYVYIPEFESIPTNIVFESEEELDDFAMYLVQRGGKSISAANPIQDVALPDGSRLNGTIYREVSSNGTTFSIRVASRARGAAELLRRRTFSPESMAFLWLAMENKCSMAFIGGTASGKTAAMNAVCSFITDKNKIVTIEDTREVRLSSQNWTPLVVRETGDSPITEFDLLVAAFRQRPEYVIVGEVRTPEGSRAAIHGINSGHTVMLTFHADSSANFFNRITNEPFNISPYIASSLSLCISLAMVTVPSGGLDVKVRRCKSISEVVGVKEDGTVDMSMIFEWNPATDAMTMKTGRSRVLGKIKEERGWDDERLIKEISARTFILRWMSENNIINEERVRKVVEYFHRDGEGMLGFIKEHPGIIGTEDIVPERAACEVEGA
ncbi:secretion system protein [Methanocella sp. CWC-04]|uniref:Secretion system protein n=1 Tax=Methanooceanicella nereidis TaxID=2052831 RepID=A0AAP2W5Z1_9EURY|nr:type II/IV secretion system ATPase subunit [Methanocella sp. CWC-04]MCD1294808.1 secretion system protein [Methanocella sp. CWC-04]